MYKTKVYGVAIACMIAFIGISPITKVAAETNTESVSLSEPDKNQKEKKSAIQEKMSQSREKWNTLTETQKQEVYALMETEMQTKTKIMDKFVEFGVMEKEDAETIKSQITENFNQIKESGDFPLIRQKGKKSSR